MPETQEILTLRNTSGDSVALTGPIYLTAHKNLGLAGVRRYTRSGPQQHGQSLGAAYLQPRVVTLQLRYQTGLEPGLEAQRTILERMLNELNHPIYLDALYPSGNERRLDVYFYAGLNAPRTAEDLWAVQTDVLQLIADDPVWYDPTPLIETWYMISVEEYGRAAGLLVPLELPAIVAPSTLLVDEVLTYGGTWECYPIWAVWGPASHVRLDNLSTGETIQLTGDGFIEPNDVWVFDLRYGYKTVRNLAGLDKIEFVTSDSDLATWRLGAHPEVTDGRNRLRLLLSDCDSKTHAEVTYWHRYRGS